MNNKKFEEGLNLLYEAAGCFRKYIIDKDPKHIKRWAKCVEESDKL